MAILRKAAACVPHSSPWFARLRQVIGGDDDVGVHLGVFVEPFLEAILDGRKTIESRFGLHRCTPFQRVQRGDTILLKRSGGPVVGLALAGDATYYTLDTEVLEHLRDRFATQLFAEDDEFWAARAEKRFASLIEIDDIVKIETMTVDKRDRRGWVTYIDNHTSCLPLAS
jgi:ASC-1-like (ASCH) protein